MKYLIDNKEEKVPNPFVGKKAFWREEDLFIDEETRRYFDDIVAYFKNRERISNEWGFGKFLENKAVGINFYGKPGTGKTVSAEALANRLGMKVIKVDYSSIESKYIGETSKNLKQLFEGAYKHKDIIFFDEADSILSKRIAQASNSTDQSSNMTKSSLLTLLDEYPVIVIFATNFFESFDNAFLRRILFHIEFKLPSIQLREKIWELHLSRKVPREQKLSYAQLAEITEGLSGGDIRNTSIRLAIRLSRELERNTNSHITKEMVIEEIENQKKSMQEQNKAVTVVEEKLEDPSKVPPHILKSLKKGGDN